MLGCFTDGFLEKKHTINTSRGLDLDGGMTVDYIASYNEYRFDRKQCFDKLWVRIEKSL